MVVHKTQTVQFDVNKRSTLQIDRDLLLRLSLTARATGQTMSDMVSRAIVTELDKLPPLDELVRNIGRQNGRPSRRAASKGKKRARRKRA